MRLTRRGQAVALIAVAAVVLGWQFGARSLNAVAAPALAALLAGAVLVSRTDAPTVELSSPGAGFPGEHRTLSLSLSGTGLVTVSLSPPEGVDCERGERQLVMPGSVEYDLELRSRGLHTVGPPTIFQRDPLGLVEREVDVTGTTTAVVYPQSYRVERGSVLSRVFLDELEAERQEFERLREYQPGDSLRRIHWKSSAKHEEFLVMEFTPSERDETVTIVATAPKGEVDEMARIVATVVDVALAAGYRVECAVPDGHIPPGHGDTHHEHLLWLLAQTGDGVVTPLSGDEADVEIAFASRNLVVRIDDREYAASELFDGESDRRTKTEDLAGVNA